MARHRRAVPTRVPSAAVRLNWQVDMDLDSSNCNTNLNLNPSPSPSPSTSPSPSPNPDLSRQTGTWTAPVWQGMRGVSRQTGTWTAPVWQGMRGVSCCRGWDSALRHYRPARTAWGLHMLARWSSVACTTMSLRAMARSLWLRLAAPGRGGQKSSSPCKECTTRFTSAPALMSLTGERSSSPCPCPCPCKESARARRHSSVLLPPPPRSRLEVEPTAEPRPGVTGQAARARATS